MAEQKSSLKKESLCEVCKLNTSKYKCPNCSLRSCSLPCVKAHKQNTGCTGKRQFTQFVPISQFDEKLLLSDYSMLEEVKRVAESAQRKRFETRGYAQFRLPFPLKSLRSAAASRKTKLLFLSSGMSKRQTNRSFHNNRYAVHVDNLDSIGAMTTLATKGWRKLQELINRPYSLGYS